jgi:hypothetical protein
MKCEKHPDNETVALCVSCRTVLCDECRVQLNGKNYCQECVEDINSKHAAENFNKESKNSTNDMLDGAVSDFKGFMKEKKIDKDIIRVKETFDNFLGGLTKQTTKEKNSSVNTHYEDIKKAKELLDMGAITEEEFIEMKKKILKSI